MIIVNNLARMLALMLATCHACHMTSNTARKLALTALLAGTVALTGACGTANDEPLFPVNDDVPALTDCLTAQGWRGDPSDGVEAVYAPQSAITACLASV